MTSHSEIAQMQATLASKGINTAICPNCGAPESGALRYKCGSFWQADGDKINMHTTENCLHVTEVNKACHVLLDDARMNGQRHHVFSVRNVEGEGEQWQVSVTKKKEKKKKSRIKIVRH